MSSVPTSPGIPPRDLPRPGSAIAVPVPAYPAAGTVVLEAVSWRGRRSTPGSCSCSTGRATSPWLVELERGRQAGASTGDGTRVTDGAAPLIGSSVAMRALRHKVERVAATDFTVLIDGESGSEAHPQLGV